MLLTIDEYFLRLTPEEIVEFEERYDGGFSREEAEQHTLEYSLLQTVLTCNNLPSYNNIIS